MLLFYLLLSLLPVTAMLLFVTWPAADMGTPVRLLAPVVRMLPADAPAHQCALLGAGDIAFSPRPRCRRRRLQRRARALYL